MTYYLNEDKTYRQCDATEWGNQFEQMDRHVGNDFIEGYHVSTVWLGLDHSYFSGPPLLFETMVFKDLEDIYMDRYTTWDEAVEGHKKAIQWVLEGCHED